MKAFTLSQVIYFYRYKPKKEKQQKNIDKRDESPAFIADMKTIKENLKMKELLRTVKINNSMVEKTPRNGKVSDGHDVDEMNSISDELTEDTAASESGGDSAESVLTSATNLNVIVSNKDLSNNSTCESMIRNSTGAENLPSETNNDEQSANSSSADLSEPSTIQSDEKSEKNNDSKRDSVASTTDSAIVASTSASPNDGISSQYRDRDRKLSLDHTILSRRDGLSQSEYDLHNLGKSPLERKSSFFKKKMDSFLRNTSEIFKRQSLGSKPHPIHRRGSMSGSLQSLNENSISSFGSTSFQQPERKGSSLSLRSSGASGSTLSLATGGTGSSGAGGARPGPGIAWHDAGVGGAVAPHDPQLDARTLSSSETFAENTGSIHSINEACTPDTLLSSRAASMSSGLDIDMATATAPRRRIKSERMKERSNRVTWLASEGLTNYFRRLIQVESEMQGCHSYSDFSTIPENDTDTCGRHLWLDSKGRRLSYQRAVSREDPPIISNYDSLARRHHIPENSMANFELSNQLAEFTRNGVPPLQGFSMASISDEAYAYLLWAEASDNLKEYYDASKWPASEETRQAVIRELISTEADYIRHLISIVEVFIAAAHALQDSGRLLDVDTERLFTNIPDVLNASLCFWELTIYPMVAEAYENKTPFNTELMSNGFCRFRDIFKPYEKYVCEQKKALEYLRSLSNSADFMMYLSWCHSQKSCNRLQLSDIIVKPMQRLTKYSIILRRIIQYTDTEPERTSLIAMESFAKNHVLDVNRSIRQKEELEKLDILSYSIESYDIDFKDEDMDKYFKMFSQLNLKAPMVNCLPTHSRTIIHQGDLRFKDNVKEMEVRVFLLTDMLLICKKNSKGSIYPYKLARPKFMVDKMIQFPKYSSNTSKDIVGIVCLMLDDVGSSSNGFSLSASGKDSNPSPTLKLWEQKIREAKLSYDFGVWFARNPSCDLSEVEIDSSSDYATSAPKSGKSSDELNIEKEARERVAAMLHHRSMGASTDCDFSQASMNTDSFDAGDPSGASGAKIPFGLRHPMHRTSTGGSSRNSRLSSFHQSTSAASHDEPPAGVSKYNYRAGSTVEHHIPPIKPDDTSAVTSITVNVVSESESETVVLTEHRTPSPSSTKMSPRSPIARRHNTLRVQPASGVMALVHSLPDLTVEPSTPKPQSSNAPSASEKLYQSHYEMLQRNRLSATHHHQYLSPDHRGTSYPPPSPTRASLKRGLAFSYSLKNPPLSKMGHVYSQSQLQGEGGSSQGPSAHGPSTGQQEHVEPASASSSREDKSGKADKKAKHVSSRNKGDKSSQPSASRKDDKDRKQAKED